MPQFRLPDGSLLGADAPVRAAPAAPAISAKPAVRFRLPDGSELGAQGLSAPAIEDLPTGAAVDRYEAENPGFGNRTGQRLTKGVRNLQAGVNANDAVNAQRELELLDMVEAEANRGEANQKFRQQLRDQYGGRVPLNRFRSGEHTISVYRGMSPEQRAQARQELQASLTEGITGTIRRTVQAAEIPSSPAATRIAEAKSFGEGVEQFTEAPLSAMGELVTSSLPAMAPGIAAAIITKRPALSMGGGSAYVESVSSLVDGLQKAGVNVMDEAQVLAALQDPTIREQVAQDAQTRGIVIGLVDALAARAGSMVLAPKSLSPTAREVANIPSQVVVGVGSGMAGEAGAQIATEGSVTEPGAVVAEGVGEGPTQVIEVGVGVRRAAKMPSDETPPTSPPPVTPVDEPPLTRGSLEEAIQSNDLSDQGQVATSRPVAPVETPEGVDVPEMPSAAPEPPESVVDQEDDAAIVAHADAVARDLGFELDDGTRQEILEAARNGEFVEDVIDEYADALSFTEASGFETAARDQGFSIHEDDYATEEAAQSGEDADIREGGRTVPAGARPLDGDGGRSGGPAQEAGPDQGAAAGREAAPDDLTDRRERHALYNRIRAGRRPTEDGSRGFSMIQEIIRRGGVDPDSPLASEFRGMDVQNPRFFRRGGMTDVDDFHVSDLGLESVFPNRIEDGRLDPQDVFDLVSQEKRGERVRTDEDAAINADSRAADFDELSRILDQELGLNIQALSNAEVDRAQDIAGQLPAGLDRDEIGARITRQIMQERAASDPDDVAAALTARTGEVATVAPARTMEKAEARETVRRYNPTLNKVRVGFKNKTEAAIYMVAAARKGTKNADAGRAYLQDQGYSDRDIDAMASGARASVRDHMKGAKPRKGKVLIPAGTISDEFAPVARTETEATRQEEPKPRTPRVEPPEPEPAELASLGVSKEGTVNGSHIADMQDQREVQTAANGAKKVTFDDLMSLVPNDPFGNPDFVVLMDFVKETLGARKPFNKMTAKERRTIFDGLLARNPATDMTDQGEQNVIPGAEREPLKDTLDRRAEGRSQPTAPQKPADDGLFDLGARNQQDLDLRLSDEAGTGSPEVQQAVIDEAERLGLGSIIDRLILNPYLRIGDNRVAGAYDRGENLLFVALNEADPKRTLRHEAIHAMRHMNVITRKEWGVLSRKAQKTWRDQYNVESRWGNFFDGWPDDVVQDKLTEEAVAEAFADHVSGAKKQTGAVAGILNRMAKFIEALGNALRGLGFRTVEGVFEALDRGGRVADRSSIDPRDDVMLMPVDDGTRQNGGEQFGHVYDELSVHISRILSNKNKTLLQRLGGAWEASKFDDRRISRAVRETVLPIRRALWDSFADLRAVQENLERQMKVNQLPEHQDGYLAQELYRSRSGARLHNAQRELYEPLIDRMSELGVDVETLETYLVARHAEERNIQIAKINPDMPDGGSGMTTDEANRILESIGDRQAAMDELAGMVDRILADARRLMVHYGLESQETIDTWEQTYQNYVPLRGRDFDEESVFSLPGEISTPPIPPSGPNFSVRGPESKRAMGRGENNPAVNMLAYALQIHQSAIVRGEKNRVGQTLMNMINDFPDPDFWTIDTPTEKRVINPSTGLVSTQADPLFANRDDVVHIKVDGVGVILHLKYAPLAKAMRNVGNDSGGMILGWLQRLNQWLSLVNTALNPEFVISNFFRDIEAASINMSEDNLVGLRNQTIKDVPKAMAGLRNRDNAADSEWAGYAKEFEKAGGRISFMGLRSVEQEAAKIRRAVKPSSNLRPDQYVRKVGGTVFDAFERYNSYVENAIRLSAYVNARRAGASPSSAAQMSLNLTVNFNRKGTWGTALNSLFLFYNATVQGNVRIAQALYRSQRVRKMVAGVVAAGFIADMMNAMMAPDDDDDDNSYDRDIPEWVKETNMILMVGDGQAIKIPMPYGYNWFWNIGRNLSAAARRQIGIGTGKKPLEAAADVGLTMLNTFNPLGGSESIFSFISPTVADPAITLLRNEDFAGRPIKPENPSSRTPKPDSQLYWNSTGPISKEMAKQLNALTGGDEFKPGLVDFSPETIEYWYEYATGAAGAFWGRNTNNLISIMNGEAPATQNIPFLRKVWQGRSEYLDKNRFYDRHSAINVAANQVKSLRSSGRFKEAIRAHREQDRLLRLKPVFDNARRQLQKVSQQKQIVRASDRPNKQALLDRLNAAEKRILDRANGAFNRLRADEQE